MIRVDERCLLPAVERLLGPTAPTLPAGGGAAGAVPPGRAEGGSAARRARAERFVEFSRANHIRIDAMWARVDGVGRITATVLAVPNPGRTAILFATEPGGPRQVRELAELVNHACGELRPLDVRLAQALLEPRQRRLREALSGGGFTPLARLSYMERPLRSRRRPVPALWPAGVTVEPYRQELRPELLAVLEASYEQTLDCPGLRGLRETEDILAGHQGTGEFDPALWTLLRRNGTACGALLLNRAPASETIELVYIGLARPARGQRLGRQLLRHGLSLLEDRTERAITLAVDEANAPAIALYRTEGFRCVLRRVAMIRPLRAAADGAA